MAAQAIVNSARKALASARGENTPGTNSCPRPLGQTPVASPLQPNKPATPDGKQKRGQADEEAADVAERVSRVQLGEGGTRDPLQRSPLAELNDENTSKVGTS